MRIGLLSSTEFGRTCLAEGIMPVPGVTVAGILTTPRRIPISYSETPVEIRTHAPFDDLADRAGAELVTVDGRPGKGTYLDAARRWGADLLLALGWYYLIPRPVLAEVPCLGIHASLLPKYRGGAPIPWAIIEGEPETGVTLFHFDEGVDTGDVVMQRRIPIGPDDTCATVYDRATAASAAVLREALPLLAAGEAPRSPQDHAAATQYPQRSPEDGGIDWGWPARRIHDFVRAQTRPYPGAFTTLDGERLTIWETRRTDAGRAAPPGTVVGAGDDGVMVATGEGTITVARAAGTGGDVAGAELARLLGGRVLGG